MKRNLDDALALLLASGKSYSEAAAELGISVKTITRRMATSAFSTRVTNLRAEMMSKAAGRLAESATAAADTLHELVTTGSPSAKLAAARLILNAGIRLHDQVVVAMRLQQLEKRLPKEKPKS